MIFATALCALLLKIRIHYLPFRAEIFARFKIILTALIIGAICFACINPKQFFKQHKEARMLTLFYPFCSSFKFIKREYFTKTVFEVYDLSPKLKDNGKKLLVFVVGESGRGMNMSLNGCQKETNFYTKNEENLISFSDFSSCGTMTMISVPCMFSSLPREKFIIEKAKYRQNLLDILQRSGVDIFWFEKNDHDCKGVCEQIDTLKTKIFSPSPFEKFSRFDDDIFAMAKDKIKTFDSNAMVVLHIRGSHGPDYARTYPREFEKFTPVCNKALEDCTYEERLNAYDNSLLYSDFLISDMISYLKNIKNFDEISLFFISDHGENLGENGFFMHGAAYDTAPIEQTKIVSMFYFSDDKRAQKFRDVKDKSFSHDNVFHTVLGYFGIFSLVYDENLDIFMSKEN